MDPLDLDTLDLDAAEFDRHVSASADVDRFCSSSDWILPAARGLMPPRTPWIRRGAHGFAALMRVERHDGSWLEPLEAAWGLACPVVGAEAAPLARELAGALAGDPGSALLLFGLERRSARFLELARALDPRYRLGIGPATVRHVADLDGGLEGFLGRRSANFRRAARKALTRADRDGVVFETVAARDDAEAAAAYERLLALDARTWKGREAVGIMASQMAEFYRAMVPRLARRGALRLAFARSAEGEDLAYILGGVRGDTYRGLQFGYLEGRESLSLGNVCQLMQIERLAQEGIRWYDLGAEVDYKRRWGEEARETVPLVALPR